MVGLHTLPIAELARLVWRRRVSSRELLRHYRDRIEKYNPALNAVVAVDFEAALEAAEACDQAAALSEFTGPLHGIPLTVKDAYETAGLVTTGGVETLREYVPEADCAVVARLKAAGAVIVGKTNVPAYSGDWQTFNAHYGVTVNPWDAALTPGGSSGGAAAAVAAGLTPAEVGADIGGSIRLPAHFCGLYGLKTSYGMVPMRGHIPPAPRSGATVDLGVAGPIARTPEDIALLLDTLSGDPNDAECPHAPLKPEPPADAGRLRIAVWRSEPAAPVDPPVRAAVEAAAAALERAGARVERGRAPAFSFADCYALYCTLLNAIVAAEFPDKVRRRLVDAARDLEPDDRSYLALQARGAALSYTEMLEIEARRAIIRRAWNAFFEQYDAILCPAAPVTAFAHDNERGPAKRVLVVNGAEVPYFDIMHWAAPASFAHLPAMVAPALQTEEGLPVGVQMIGPYAHDRTLIRIARILEQHLTPFVAPPGFD